MNPSARISGSRNNQPVGHIAYRKYQLGIPVPIKKAVGAYCYDCMGFYTDGRVDCENARCMLYPWMPYRGVK